MSGSPTKQATQTIIRVALQTENQGLCRYTFTGYAERPQTYTIIIDGAKNLEKGMIMHIADELNRYLGYMTAHDLSDEVNVFKKNERHSPRSPVSGSIGVGSENNAMRKMVCRTVYCCCMIPTKKSKGG